MINSCFPSSLFAFGAPQTAGTREHVAQLENQMITALILMESGQLREQWRFFFFPPRSVDFATEADIRHGLSHEVVYFAQEC